MRATLTRDGRYVGVFVMTRDGKYSWNGLDDERESFDEVKRIINDLGEPKAWVGRVGNTPEPVIYKPGDPRWFDRVLARLQNKGYEHVVLDDGS